MGMITFINSTHENIVAAIVIKETHCAELFILYYVCKRLNVVVIIIPTVVAITA